MQLTDQFVRLPLEQVVVKPDRQRKAVYDASGQFINPDGLLEGIQAHGVIHPIVVNRAFELVTGERRLEASRTLGLSDIPCRFVEDLSPVEAEKLELMENIQRLDLPWRDEVMAVARLHALYCSTEVGWTWEDTARVTNYTQIHTIARVARDIHHPSIALATSTRQAWNVLARKDDRVKQDALADISNVGVDLFADVQLSVPGVATAAVRELQEAIGFLPQERSSPLVAEIVSGVPGVPSESLPSIINTSFLEWASLYSGHRFNLVHCDFPYSVGAFEGEMSGRDRWETYDDSQASAHFDELVQCLCLHLDKLMAPSGHLIFWLPSDVKHQWRTLEMFRELAPSLEFWPKPLVWHKTDNVGILSDPKRKPRHVYESALVASREDRLLAQATSDCYGSPTDKQHHPSTKPEPMLRYFFQLFVDEHTRLLDPTCGGGSALRAAESLGASFVFGLENSPEHFDSATKALKQFRVKRALQVR